MNRLCYSEDEELLVEGRNVVPFDILAVSTITAEQFRLDDGTPYLKVQEGPGFGNLCYLGNYLGFLEEMV